MKLKQLEICGFKSFPDKTLIPFPEGVSAIVGPNGCGKSNIVDAIQWVTGEQSVKQLRGKSMDDVIFAGSSKRPPVNMAEVSITFANNNGSVPEQFRNFSEIMVTRRLYRSGERGYFINKQPCRLKDIQHLLMGSGIGSRTYAVIQQGNIGAITEAGPEQRRVFIEEAAGITRYKARKKEALSKIGSTKNNLLRVMDIITEVERNMRSLRRQAKKAERYKQYKTKIEKIDIALAAYKYGEYTARIAETDSLLEQFKDQELSHAAQLNKLDAAIEQIRDERAAASEDARREQTLHFDLKRDVGMMEKDLEHAKAESARIESESKDFESQMAELIEKKNGITQDKDNSQEDKENATKEMAAAQKFLADEEQSMAGVRHRLAESKAALEDGNASLNTLMGNEARYNNIYQTASSNKKDIARRLRRLSEEVVHARTKEEETKKAFAKAEDDFASVKEENESIGQELVYIENALEEKRAELGAQLKNVQTIEMERSKVRSRYAALKRVEGNLEWFQGGVREIMAWSAENNQRGVSGILADAIVPESGYEEAVEAALGDALQYVIVDENQTALDAMGHLADSNKGRAGFLPKSWMDTNENQGQATHKNALLNHVEISEGCEHLVQGFLANVLVAEDANSALNLKNGYNHLTVVTKDGAVMVSPHGLVGGSRDESHPGILAQRQQIRDLEAKIEALEKELVAEKEKLEQLEKDARGLENDLQQMVEARRELGHEEMEAQKEVSRLTEENRLETRHCQIVQAEYDQLTGEEDDAETELARYKNLTDEAAQEVDEAKKAVESATINLTRAELELEAFSEKTYDLRVEISALLGRLDNQNKSLARLKEYEDENQARIEQCKTGMERRKIDAQTTIARVSELEHNVLSSHAKLAEADKAMEKMEAARLEIESELEKSDHMQSQIKSDYESMREKVRELELSQSQRKLKQEAVAERILEKLGRSLDQAIHDEDLPELLTEQAVQEVKSELEDFRQKMERLGDVHLGAINEYETLEERYEFLTRQRDDLLNAIEALQKVIRKINRFTQKRFLETFEAVNKKLELVFPRLFAGGTACLVLSEPDKPLETGVGYVIRPQGKKLTRMSLLSGGEKALSAIAFIFSIFLIKPASFCLMDEIDAPLDDANVSRFNELLKLIGEKSQIVMVTHNKSSMEFADMLFGITMESKGISKVVSVNLEKAPVEQAA